MTDSQKYAARNTFAKRYAFCNVFGITTGDEDIDASDKEEKNKPAPNDPKAKIVALLKEYGVESKSPEETKTKILDLTQLEATEENYEEIISRLETLVRTLFLFQ